MKSQSTQRGVMYLKKLNTTNSGPDMEVLECVMLALSIKMRVERKKWRKKKSKYFFQGLEQQVHNIIYLHLQSYSYSLNP